MRIAYDEGIQGIPVYVVVYVYWQSYWYTKTLYIHTYCTDFSLGVERVSESLNYQVTGERAVLIYKYLSISGHEL